MNFMLFQVEHHGCSSQCSLSEALFDLSIKTDKEMCCMVNTPELCQNKIW